MSALLPEDVASILEWASIDTQDQRDVVGLLQARPATALADHLARLRRNLGKIGYHDADRDADEFDWLAALLWFIPEQTTWYRNQGVSDEVARATMADIGRHIAISRRTTGQFGCQTWWWLLQQASCSLFQLGRLQFQIQAHDPALPVGEEQYCDIGVHIPETGPMPPRSVEVSLAQVRPFFNQVYGQDVAWGVCSSWLLDPYLVQALPKASNIVNFARRFEPYGELQDSPNSALYFTFRTHDLTKVPHLPREYAIQRVVLERIEAGGTWQTGSGYLPLPPTV